MQCQAMQPIHWSFYHERHRRKPVRASDKLNHDEHDGVQAKTTAVGSVAQWRRRQVEARRRR